MNTKKIGNEGEKTAVRYLKKNKYRILETSFRHGRGEIDIIAFKKGFVVFIEVKTRRSERYGRPEEYVTLQKQRQIRKVAQGYLARENLLNALCRFDVLALTADPKKGFRVRHIVNAF